MYAMIAEIKGKLSQSGSNLKDTLEDNLTGNFFGSLRYVPFNLALRNILSNGVYPNTLADYIKRISNEFWSDKIKFWPYDSEGEIDALINFDDTIIGIEVKYLSGLSSDDDIDNSEQMDALMEKDKSKNQLARESRIVSRNGAGQTKILLFIANSSSCRKVYNNVINRGIIESGVLLGYITWQSILAQMQTIKLENPFYQIIIEDLISLLTKKGFESFKDMRVTVNEDIVPDGFYKFGSSDSLTFNFDTNIIIERGLYYEFS
jgi:hypothetical protein